MFSFLSAALLAASFLASPIDGPAIVLETPVQQLEATMTIAADATASSSASSLLSAPTIILPSIPSSSASEPTSSPEAIIVPIGNQITPSPSTSFGGDFDPFDVSNSTMCWKGRQCVRIKLSEQERQALRDARDFEMMDDDFVGGMGGGFDEVDEFKTQCTWIACPASMPVTCGLGCAVSKEDCQLDIYHQISSVAEVAFNVGQIIMSVVSAGGTNSILQSTGLRHWLQEAGERLAVQAFKHILTGKVGKEAADKLAEQILGRAVGSSNATIDWTIADPSGVSQVVKSFWKPICASPSPSS